MTLQQIYYSPLICYEVTEEEGAFGVDVYYSEFKDSEKPELHCIIKNFSETSEKAHSFAKELAKNCALPLHIPELAEEFLSL